MTPKHREGVNRRSKRYREAHPEKNKARVAAWNKAHPQAMAAATTRSRWKRLGIDIATLPAKDDACLCGRSEKLTMDHDHVTGKFRGWLCGKCNTILGMAGDDPDVLRLLATYLDVVSGR